MILAYSPHLDDVVFSAAGYLYDRARLGERVKCVTVFTASVPGPTGFALACQTDKGLAPEVDYMALRRREDAAACDRLSIDYKHWRHREAPHRGYDSAAELFAGIKTTDPLNTHRLRGQLHDQLQRLQPREVLYPYGAGNHVDHLQLIKAVDELRGEFPDIRFRQYYDMPYARKFADRYPELNDTVKGYELSDKTLRAKVTACAAYASQVGFQFGGADKIAAVLGHQEYFRTAGE